VLVALSKDTGNQRMPSRASAAHCAQTVTKSPVSLPGGASRKPEPHLVIRALSVITITQWSIDSPLIYYMSCLQPSTMSSLYFLGACACAAARHLWQWWVEVVATGAWVGVAGAGGA
jgi:hypothetical protein